MKQLEMFITKHEKICLFVGMVLGIALLEGAYLRTYPLHTTTDELGAIAGAAVLAGYDWSGVINRSGYYGFGYYSLFAPLFMLKLSPIVIYRLIILITCIIRGSAIFGMVYYIGKKYFHFSSRIELMILSGICIIPVYSLNWVNLINDLVLDVCFWFIILSICKMIEYINELGKFIIWMLLYIAASTWILFLHTRALVVLGASVIVLIGIGIIKRKTVFFSSLFMIPITFLAELGIRKYQDLVWGTTTGVELANTSVNIETNFSLLEWKTWKIWLDMLIGQISVETLLTGGLFLVSIICVLKYLFMLFTKKDMQQGNIYLNVVIFISCICMVATFGAFMLSNWFTGIYHTWNTEKMGSDYIYKALCYVRYWGVYASPFLFAGIYLVGKEKYHCLKPVLLSGAMLLFLFVEWVVPIVQNNSGAASFLFAYLTDKNEQVTAQLYYKAILICMIFVASTFLIYYSKKDRKWIIFPTLVLMIIGYYQANINYNDVVKEKISSMVLSSYEQKSKMEQDGMKIGQIYAFDDRQRDRNWYIFSVLQFYFYDYRIEDEYPINLEANDIIVTYDRSTRIESDFPQLKCYRLDDNEVWYTGIDLSRYKLVEG